MISKISCEEIIKGFINDYTLIKDDFKIVIKKNGFYWNRDKERINQFGREGEWTNLISGLSVRVRWGKVSPRAIIYVEKEFFDVISKFFVRYKLVNGMKSPNEDFKTLNLVISGD